MMLCVELNLITRFLLRNHKVQYTDHEVTTLTRICREIPCFEYLLKSGRLTPFSDHVSHRFGNLIIGGGYQ